MVHESMGYGLAAFVEGRQSSERKVSVVGEPNAPSSTKNQPCNHSLDRYHPFDAVHCTSQI